MVLVLLSLIEVSPIKINPCHTREHFIEILAVIDAYEDYCRSHPDYKNNRCICAVANIKRVYNERLQKHDFL